MKFFWRHGIFYMIFVFKNGFKNEYKDNNEKSCSWSINRVSREIDFKVRWLRNSHADSVGVEKLYLKMIRLEKLKKIFIKVIWLKKVFLEIPVPQFSFWFFGPRSTYDAKWEISEYYVLPV